MGGRPQGPGNLALRLSAQSIGRNHWVRIMTVAMSGPMSVPMPEKVHGEHTKGERDPNPITSKPGHHTTLLQQPSGTTSLVSITSPLDVFSTGQSLDLKLCRRRRRL